MCIYVYCAGSGKCHVGRPPPRECCRLLPAVYIYIYIYNIHVYIYMLYVIYIYIYIYELGAHLTFYIDLSTSTFNISRWGLPSHLIS